MLMKNKAGCLFALVILTINATIGAWSVIQILSWFGKSIPMIANIILGLFVGEISIPIAIVGYILKICGIF